MKSIKLFSSVCLVVYLSFCVACRTSYPHKYPPTAATRIHLKMPKLVEMTRFKSELPLKELKTLRDHFKKQGSAMPAFNYFFSIDKNGDVVSGKFDGSNNNQLIFFDSYINNIFNKYKWYPAFYSNTKEKLRTAVNMSIYDHKGDIFKVSIRLMYLLDKEKIEDIVFEKNLIYEIEIN